MSKLFEGEERYKSPISETDGIWSVTNMSDEDLRSSILEQALILYMEYKKEEFTFEEFMSALRMEDCIETYVQKFRLSSSNIIKNKAREMGMNRYWSIWTRCYKMILQLISSGHLIMVSDDLSYRKKNTILRFFPRNSSGDVIHHTCQHLMNECGVWWDGYTIPDNANIVSLTQEGKDLLANNSLEDIAQIFAYEMLHGSSDENIH